MHRATKFFLDTEGSTKRNVLNFLEVNYFRKAVYSISRSSITRTSNTQLSSCTSADSILERPVRQAM